MLTILTAYTTPTEKGAVAAARTAGIPCAVTKPQRSGPRRSYRKCLQECAAASDATLVLGDRVPPYSSDIDSIWGPWPIRTLSVAAELRFDPSGDNTRKWLRKHRVKTLHVTGSAPRAVAARFLRAVLKPER